MEKFEIVLIAWRDNFIDLLCHYFLPSLLAPGNLPSWPYREQTTFVLYTTEGDWARFDADPSTARLRKQISVEFRSIAAFMQKDKYSILSDIHMEALQQAQGSNTSVLLPMPDMVMTDGSLKALAQEMDAGYTVWLVAGPRLDQDTFAAEVSADPATGILAISPAQGVDRLLRHPHPIAQSLFWDGPGFTGWPSNICYWRDSCTLEFRCFHIHPLCIRAPITFPSRSNLDTIDGSFLQQYMAQPDKIRVVDDESILLISLTPATETSYWILEGEIPLDERQLILDRFARERCLPIHRWIFRHPIRLRGTAALAGLTRQDNSRALAALDAMDVYWQLEQMHSQGDAAGVVALYGQYGERLLEHFKKVYFYFGFYYIASGYFALEQWETLLTFLKQYRIPMKSLFSMQFGYRLPLEPKPVVDEPGYTLVFLATPALDSETVAALPAARHHIYLDATNLADQEQLEEFYTRLSLPSQPIVVPRQGLAPGELAAYLTGAGTLVLPANQEHRDLVFWGTVNDKQIVFIPG